MRLRQIALVGADLEVARADITAVLTKSGLSLDKIPQFMSLLIDFLKQKLGSDLFATVASKLPDLLGKK